jgi:hypothetical protein
MAFRDEAHHNVKNGWFSLSYHIRNWSPPSFGSRPIADHQITLGFESRVAIGIISSKP